MLLRRANLKKKQILGFSKIQLAARVSKFVKIGDVKNVKKIIFCPFGQAREEKPRNSQHLRKSQNLNEWFPLALVWKLSRKFCFPKVTMAPNLSSFLCCIQRKLTTFANKKSLIPHNDYYLITRNFCRLSQYSLQLPNNNPHRLRQVPPGIPPNNESHVVRLGSRCKRTTKNSLYRQLCYKPQHERSFIGSLGKWS